MMAECKKRTLKVKTDTVNYAIRYFKSKNVTKTNYLTKFTSLLVEEQIGLKKRDYRENKNKNTWKRRSEGDIKKLRQDVNFLASST